MEGGLALPLFFEVFYGYVRFCYYFVIIYCWLCFVLVFCNVMIFRRLFVSLLLSSFLFVGTAKAFLPLIPLAFEAAAARAVVGGFFARSVVSSSLGVASIRGVGSQIMKIKLDTVGIVGIGAAVGALASLMGYSDSVAAGSWRVILPNGQGVLTSGLASFQAAQAAGGQYCLDNAGVNANYRFVYGDVLCNVAAFSTSVQDVGVVPVVPASDVLISDIANSPTQSLTDSIVSNLSTLSVLDPVSFDKMVVIEDQPKTQLPSDYFSGDSIEVMPDGQYVVNGVVQNAATYIGKDGILHTMTIDALGSVLVDGQASNGFTASNLANAATAASSSASSALNRASSLSDVASASSAASRASSLASQAAAAAAASPSDAGLAAAATAAAAAATAASNAATAAQTAADAKQAALDAQALEISTTKTAAAGIAPVVGSFLGGVTSGSAPPSIILHGSDGSIMFESNLTNEVSSTGIPAVFVTLLGFMGLFAGLAFTLREIL